MKKGLGSLALGLEVGPETKDEEHTKWNRFLKTFFTESEAC